MKAVDSCVVRSDFVLDGKAGAIRVQVDSP
jgi:hypothetical protein